jgi:hypothetical protein
VDAPAIREMTSWDRNARARIPTNAGEVLFECRPRAGFYGEALDEFRSRADSSERRHCAPPPADAAAASVNVVHRDPRGRVFR